MLGQPNSPPAGGGLQPNDVVTHVNSQPVKSIATVKQVLDDALRNKPAQTVNLMVQRGDQQQAVSIQPRARGT
jgi:S1-C subfamily serine protease